MALKEQKIIQDDSSDLLDELRRQFNLLLEQIDALGGMETVQDLQADVQANVKKVTRTREIPKTRRFPVR